VIESPEGIQYKRNTTHVRQHQERENNEREVEETPALVQQPLRPTTLIQYQMEAKRKEKKAEKDQYALDVLQEDFRTVGWDKKKKRTMRTVYRNIRRIFKEHFGQVSYGLNYL
jgi:hypothetical protein